jgi:hypothetical protein
MLSLHPSRLKGEERGKGKGRRVQKKEEPKGEDAEAAVASDKKTE